MVRSSVRLLAMPQKLEMESFEAKSKLEPRTVMEYSGTVAARKAKSEPLELERRMFTWVSIMVTFAKTKKNRLKGCLLRSNSASMRIEKALWFTSLKRTLSVLEQRSHVETSSNVKVLSKTSCNFSQNGLQKAQLQQKSNSARENVYNYVNWFSKLIIKCFIEVKII
ncbi:Hypothetical_protein [Hexamita inflata]|uniref:Hypothetical_protein n=1 Tax=Hexamita inflata TaxID=28002 RepID=A0AA86TYU3_9EUKA|nr:Hypothetical protein HINF_LOCUS13248 [Hexamita inflata]CAI9966747.1 Hypothetical protein HINF_LOCUS54392 [Hexamita inflata]